MTLIRNNSTTAEKQKQAIFLLLLILFPDSKINFLPNSILIIKDQEHKLIDKNNFQFFKKNLREIFCLDALMKDDIKNKYNPGGPQAKALVQKFKERQKRLAELRRRKGQSNQITILSQYISILAVGLQKDINDLSKYTVYQLFDEYERFRKKQEYDLNIRFRIAGAKDVKITNWMSDLYTQNNDYD